MLEDIIPIAPIHFFALQLDCLYFRERKKHIWDKAHYLPDLSALSSLENFAEIALGWSEKGFFIFLDVKRPLLKCEFPQLQKGDSLELFFDTRDVKNSGYNTKFCHHFYFLPQKIKDEEKETPQAAEITHFRGEDKHELCDPSLLIASTIEKRNSYQMNIFIPKECLHGFDPLQFERIGFSYRINRFEGEPQCLSANPNNFSIEQQPALWASLKLIKPS